MCHVKPTRNWVRDSSARAVMAIILLPCLSLAAGAAASPVPFNPPAGAATTKVSVQMTFIEPAGAILADRRVELSLGKTETITVQQGNRTVAAETTVWRGARPGCHRIDVTLRDRTIDATGHFNKTVWQSGSEPCGNLLITLGPKEETRLQIAITPAR